MIYHGRKVQIRDDFQDPRDDISVYQQHCGGENTCVYQGRLLKGERFQFISKRNHGFPFSLTFFLNGMFTERISTCCEYRHKPGYRQGKKRRYFSVWKVLRSSPCHRCILAKATQKAAVSVPADHGEDGSDGTLSSSDEDTDEESVQSGLYFFSEREEFGSSIKSSRKQYNPAIKKSGATNLEDRLYSASSKDHEWKGRHAKNRPYHRKGQLTMKDEYGCLKNGDLKGNKQRESDRVATNKDKVSCSAQETAIEKWKDIDDNSSCFSSESDEETGVDCRLENKAWTIPTPKSSSEAEEEEEHEDEGETTVDTQTKEIRSFTDKKQEHSYKSVDYNTSNTTETLSNDEDKHRSSPSSQGERNVIESMKALPRPNSEISNRYHSDEDEGRKSRNITRLSSEELSEELSIPSEDSELEKEEENVDDDDDDDDDDASGREYSRHNTSCQPNELNSIEENEPLFTDSHSEKEGDGSKFINDTENEEEKETSDEDNSPRPVSSASSHSNLDEGKPNDGQLTNRILSELDSDEDIEELLQLFREHADDDN
ncbi:glutamate-rich protein 3-like [Protopterus annectens]|uniref:glutamate-rich protein 3-like n=1 Tax=Protopterus annectens TaxID=7888 RepID=UPI001CF9A072|nr:glutamate-rich protein 3-like [Protopterus annectens]